MVMSTVKQVKLSHSGGAAKCHTCPPQEVQISAVPLLCSGLGKKGSSMYKLVLVKLQCAPKSPGESCDNAGSHSVGLGQH